MNDLGNTRVYALGKRLGEWILDERPSACLCLELVPHRILAQRSDELLEYLGDLLLCLETQDKRCAGTSTATNKYIFALRAEVECTLDSCEKAQPFLTLPDLHTPL